MNDAGTDESGDDGSRRRRRRATSSLNSWENTSSHFQNSAITAGKTPTHPAATHPHPIPVAGQTGILPIHSFLACTKEIEKPHHLTAGACLLAAAICLAIRELLGAW